MAIKEMTRVWDESKQDSTALLVLLAIADKANDWGHAWPGRLHLKKYARCEMSTVSRLIEKMEADGELFVCRKKGRGNHYAILTGLSDIEQQRRKQMLLAYLKIESSDEMQLPPEKSSDNPSPVPVQGCTETETTGSSGSGTNSSLDTSVDTSLEPPVVATGGTDESKDIFKLLHTLWGKMVSGAHEMQEWVELEKDYPIDWIEDAMKEAVDLGGGSKLSLRYIRAPLARWKAEGREVKRPAAQSPAPIPLRRLVVDTTPMNEDDRQRFLRDMEAKRVAKSA
jgi:hypothetical protein